MRPHNLLRALLFACLAPATLRGAEPIDIPAHGAASTTFASTWADAFVAGNGKMGAMVIGSNPAATPPRPNEDTLYFSHAGLFLPVGSKQIVPILAPNLADLRLTIRTKGYGPAVMSAYAAAQKQEFPGITYTDPFLPALELKLKMPSVGITRNYLRTENFQTGEVAISWSDDNGSFLRKLFISRADNVAVLWIGHAPSEAPSKSLISCEVSVPAIPNIPVRTYLQNNPAAKPADAAANALIQSSADADPAGITIHNSYREGKGSGYDAALRIIPEGGATEVIDRTLSVKEARSLLLLLRIKPFTQTTANSERELRLSLSDIPPRYDNLLAAHKKIHQPLFDRVSLNLATAEDRKQTTDALITRANTENKLSPALLEKLYDGSRYAQICASGDTPPNLQGIWAALWAPTPTLAGDYAFDSCFQLDIASALSCNTPELLTGLFRLADQNRPAWQANAKKIFGTRGIVVPAHQSSTGQNLQWSDRSSGGLLWTAGAGILAHSYYDYFLHTGDRQFLARQAVPFMKLVADFYEDFLFLDPNGTYRFSPSFSADNAAGDNSTQDIMVAKELLTNLITACKLLKTDPDGIARWQTMLDQMPPYLVSPNGELQEWALPGISNKSGHRHTPHLYAIYASREFDPETTPAMWTAALAAYHTRLNQWFKPPTRATDMNPQPIQDRMVMGLCAARFGEAAIVDEVLTRLAACNTYCNMLTQRYEDARTLVADGNAIPEILNTALVHSQPGRLDLLPALPPSIPTGEIRGLAARSTIAPITITRLAWTPREIQIDLVSPADQPLEIRALKFTPQKVILKANQPTRLKFP